MTAPAFCPLLSYRVWPTPGVNGLRRIFALGISSAYSSKEFQVVHGLEESVGEVGDVVRRWREVVGGLEAANTMLTIHTLLDDAHQKELNHEFLQTAKNLNEVGQVH